MPAINSFTTAWTGQAGDGDWNNAANWSNGVPPSGADYGVPDGNGGFVTNTATIDNPPGPIVLSGDIVGSLIKVTAVDPVGEPSLKLTAGSSLDLSTNGGGFGTLELFGGTFIVDGGTLRGLTIEQNDPDIGYAGQVAFRGGGPITLAAVGIQGDVTFDNGATVDVQFAIFERRHSADGLTSNVTIQDGASVDVTGTMAVAGVIYVNNGGSLVLHDTLQGQDGYAVVVAASGDGAFTIANDVTLRNVVLDGNITIGGDTPLTLNVEGLFGLEGFAPTVLDMKGGTININGLFDLGGSALSNATVHLTSNSSIQIDTRDLGPNSFDNVTLDASDFGDSPFVLDLQGKTLTVNDTLHLRNVTIENGTLALADGAVLDLDSASSIDPSTTVTGGSVDPGTVVDGTTSLFGTPDLHIAAGERYTMKHDSTLQLVTGSSGDEAGIFFLDQSDGDLPDGTIAGEGFISVQDSADGGSRAEIQGTLLANVPEQVLRLYAHDWHLTGTAHATNGAILELGDNQSGGNLSGGTLKDGYYIADANSAIFVDGDAPIQRLENARITLNGENSDIRSVVIVDDNNFILPTLEETLVAIGRDGNDFQALASLTLGEGRNFYSNNDISVNGAIFLEGGTFQANSLDLRYNFISLGQFGQVFSAEVVGFGSLSGPVSLHGGVFDARDGTLTVSGPISGTFGSLVAEDHSTLIVSNGLTPGEITNLTFLLRSESVVEINGLVNHAQARFMDSDASSAEGAVLAFDDAHGVAVTFGGEYEGNAIHLIGVQPVLGGGIDISNAGSQLQITVHPDDAGGDLSQDDVFTLTGVTNNIGVQVQADGAGGTYLRFVEATFLADPVIDTVTLSKVHEQEGGETTTAVTIFNRSSGSGEQDKLEGKVGALGGDAVGEGEFSDLEAGEASQGITVGVKTDHAGHVTGSVQVQFDSIGESPYGDIDRPLASQTINVSADVYRLAEASFPEQTIYIHRSTDTENPLVHLALKVKNSAAADGYSEGLVAEITDSVGFFTIDDGADPHGKTGVIASGQTDSSSLGFYADGSADAPTHQQGAFTIAETSDGTGTSDLGTTELDPENISVEVIINDYAKAVFDGKTATSAGALQDNGVVVFNVYLGTFLQGSSPISHALRVSNQAVGPADFLAGSLFVDPLIDDAANFSEYGGSAFANLGPSQTYSQAGLQLFTGNLGRHVEGIVLDPRSVNPSDPAGTLLTPIEIVYSFDVIKNPTPPAPPEPNQPPKQPIGPAGTVGGDPHLVTFDGLRYDFQAVGEFVLVKSTTSDPFEVQIRTAPAGGSTHVSVISQAAIRIGDHHVTIDAARQNAIWIDGHAATLGTNGTIDLGSGQVQRLGSGNDFSIVSTNGETVQASVSGSLINLTVGLGSGHAQNTIAGLLGNYDGAADNDIALANGSSLGTSPSFGDLYGSYADSWRVTQASSLFDYASGETTATFTNSNFPAAPVQLANLPDDVVARAAIAVDQAGITDPNARADAILDYALTNNQDFIAAAQIQQQTTIVQTVVTVAPPPPVTPPNYLGIATTTPQTLSGTAAGFEVYRTGDTSQSLTVFYTVEAPDGGYINAADFGGALPSGQITFDPGISTASFVIALPDIGADVFDKTRVTISLGAAPPASAPTLITPSAEAVVVNAMPTEGEDASLGFVELSGGGTLTQNGNNWTLDIGTLVQNGDAPTLSFAVANLASGDGNFASGSYSLNGSGFTLGSAYGPQNLIGGKFAAGLTLTANNGNVGSFEETVTLHATQGNVSGFSGALPDITLTIRETVVAPLTVALETQALTNDTGASSGDRVTRDGHVALSGHVAGGVGSASVTIFNGASQIGAAIVNADGSWSFAAVLGDGVYQLNAMASDGAKHVATGAPAAEITVDSAAPSLTAIVDSPSTGALSSGQSMTISLGVSEAVSVFGGIPTLTLNDGGTATYNALASTVTTLVFDYTVADGDTAVPSLAAVSFNPNGALVVDAAGNALLPTLAGLSQVGPAIVGSAAAVTAVTTSPATGDFHFRDQITITLTMSENVIVVGKPTLTLNDGGIATFDAAHSTAASLVFSYTVGSGQNTQDLQVAGFNLPAGATIQTSDGRPADLSGASADLGLHIDTNAPSILTISGGTAGTYLRAGDMLLITVTTNEAVVVTGMPTLRLSGGGMATYDASLSSATALAFTYTVAAGQNTSDMQIYGFAIPAGASIADLAGNRLNQANSTADLDLVVDTRAPSIRKIEAVGVAGPLAAGSAITILMEMREAVTVSGTPTLTLNDGGVATFDAANSSPLSLAFHYVVQAGQNVANLAVTSVGLSGTGDSIRDLAGNVADLSHSFANLNVRVDAVAPTITAIRATPDRGDLRAGQKVQIAVDFSEAVQITGVPSLTLSDGGVATYASAYSTATTKVFVYTVASGQNAASLAVTGITLPTGARLADASGNNADLSGLSATFPIQVDTVGPTIMAISASQSGGTLHAGDTLQITLSMSEAVTADGAPSLLLNDGGIATFDAALSSSRDLVFNYTVSPGEHTADLKISGAQSGGTFLDLAANRANLTAAHNTDLGLAVDATGAMDSFAARSVGSPDSNSVVTLSEDQSFEIAGPSNQNIAFADGAAATLKLDAPAQYGGSISGFGPGDKIDLPELAFSRQPTLGYSGNVSGGVLTVSDAAAHVNASLALLGNYLASTFVTSGDGLGGTIIAETQPSTITTLTRPSA